MIRNILAEALETTDNLRAEFEPFPQVPFAAEVVIWALAAAGILRLVGWLVSTHGRNPLAYCPIRRHRIPSWFVPLQLLIWLLGSYLIMKVAESFFEDTESQAFVITVYISSLFWYTILISFFLAVAWLGFARRLCGFGLRWRTAGRDLAMGTLTLMAIWPLIQGLLLAVYLIGRWLFPDFIMDQHSSLMDLGDFPQWWMRVLIISNAILIVPLFEEVLFRGLLQSTLTAQLRRPWLSIALTSILFACFHPYPTHWPALLVLSVGFGYAYEKSGSLLRPIFMHMIFNAANIAMSLISA